jgi:hypothetical protein
MAADVSSFFGPGGPKKVVVAIGVPIRVQETNGDGTPIEVSPIRAKFDEGVHVWEGKGFAVEEVKCFLGTPISLQDTVNDLRRKYPTDESVSPMIFTTYNSPWKTTVMVPLSESATEIFKGTSDPNVRYLSGTWLSKVYDIPFASLSALDYAVLGIQRWVKQKTGRRTSITKDFYVGYTLDNKGITIKNCAVLFARIA